MKNVRPVRPRVEAELLRIKDLTKWLGMSRSWIYKACQENRFPPPIRLGRRFTVWRRCDIERWLSNLSDDK